MKIALLQTGKTTEQYIVSGVDTYSQRIKRYTAFEIITIPAIRNNRNMPLVEQKDKEGKKIIESAGKNDYIVLLDEGGTQMNTAEFAVWLEKQMMYQTRRILFVIGGPWGFAEDVYKISDMKLSLSKMTFSHQMVRLLFAEQLYRAFTIIKGEPYHHD